MKLRSSLETPTDRIAKLPVDERGYQVPWFVAWIDGKPEFRAMDPHKWVRAVKENLCWVCGEKIGAHKAFVIGPMCGINRTTAEPPAHQDCAEWSARNCPFLSNPNMVRREDELTRSHEKNVAGIQIKRNPGVCMIWTTKSYRAFNDGQGRPLIRIGDPIAILWYAEGKEATRAQVVESVESGYPILLKMAREQDGEEPGAGAEAFLVSCKRNLEWMYPA